MRIVITGAGRGIGLELVRQYLARGDEIEAAARDPGRSIELAELARQFPQRLHLHTLDVADDASVARFAAVLAPGPVDVLVNNAGVMGKWQSLEDLDLADVLATFSVNALGAVRVTRALLRRLEASSVRKVVHMSSKMGSIDDNNSGGAYAYRLSKAALNMAARSMAVDFKSRGITSVALHPGWVQTDMGGTEEVSRIASGASGRVTDTGGRSRRRFGEG